MIHCCDLITILDKPLCSSPQARRSTVFNPQTFPPRNPPPPILSEFCHALPQSPLLVYHQLCCHYVQFQRISSYTMVQLYNSYTIRTIDLSIIIFHGYKSTPETQETIEIFHETHFHELCEGPSKNLFLTGNFLLELKEKCSNNRQSDARKINKGIHTFENLCAMFQK